MMEAYELKGKWRRMGERLYDGFILDEGRLGVGCS